MYATQPFVWKNWPSEITSDSTTSQNAVSYWLTGTHVTLQVASSPGLLLPEI